MRASDGLGRLGGDEFAVIMEDVTAPLDAALACERMMASMSIPFLLAGQATRIGASLGIALYPEDGTDAATLPKGADVAMYDAKRGGRNRFEFFQAKGTPRGGSAPPPGKAPPAACAERCGNRRKMPKHVEVGGELQSLRQLDVEHEQRHRHRKDPVRQRFDACLRRHRRGSDGPARQHRVPCRASRPICARVRRRRTVRSGRLRTLGLKPMKRLACVFVCLLLMGCIPIGGRVSTQFVSPPLPAGLPG